MAINKAQKEEGRIVYEAYKGIYSSIRVIGNVIMANTVWVPAKGSWCSAAVTNTDIEPGKQWYPHWLIILLENDLPL